VKTKMQHTKIYGTREKALRGNFLAISTDVKIKNKKNFKSTT
jgi:hypothetical protein